MQSHRPRPDRGKREAVKEAAIAWLLFWGPGLCHSDRRTALPSSTLSLSPTLSLSRHPARADDDWPGRAENSLARRPATGALLWGPLSRAMQVPAWPCVSVCAAANSTASPPARDAFGAGGLPGAVRRRRPRFRGRRRDDSLQTDGRPRGEVYIEELGRPLMGGVFFLFILHQHLLFRRLSYRRSLSRLVSNRLSPSSSISLSTSTSKAPPSTHRSISVSPCSLSISPPARRRSLPAAPSRSFPCLLSLLSPSSPTRTITKSTMGRGGYN